MMEWQSSTGRSLGRRASQFEAISSKVFQTRTSTVLFGPGIAVMQHPRSKPAYANSAPMKTA